MIRVAIVEDEKSAAEVLMNHLNLFGKNNDCSFSIVHFDNAIDFLNKYNNSYDIVFMDIDMANMDGMTAAEKLRKMDSTVILIFVTNLAQYAVKGYEVEALDFIVKPVSYYGLDLKLKRVIKRINDTIDLKISINDSIIKIKTSDIYYIETNGHKVIYHTKEGDYTAYGSLKNIETLLINSHFERCNACYLVNLKHVKSDKGYVCVVGNDTLSISHNKRKDFVNKLNNFMGWC